MCGIAGLVGHENYELPLQAMLQSQAHRGPDFTGVYYDKNFAALGHNRLSIIDLSSHPLQIIQNDTILFLMVKFIIISN
mgnify:CR=1 FL=1